MIWAGILIFLIFQPLQVKQIWAVYPYPKPETTKAITANTLSTEEGALFEQCATNGNTFSIRSTGLSFVSPRGDDP